MKHHYFNHIVFVFSKYFTLYKLFNCIFLYIFMFNYRRITLLQYLTMQYVYSLSLSLLLTFASPTSLFILFYVIWNHRYILTSLNFVARNKICISFTHSHSSEWSTTYLHAIFFSCSNFLSVLFSKYMWIKLYFNV